MLNVCTDGINQRMSDGRMNSRHFERKDREKPNIEDEERGDFSKVSHWLGAQLSQNKAPVRATDLGGGRRRTGSRTSHLLRNTWLNASLNKPRFCSKSRVGRDEI